MAKASRIIAVDLNPDKWEIAKALGATDFVNPKELSGTTTEAIVELTKTVTRKTINLQPNADADQHVQLMTLLLRLIMKNR